MEMFWELTGRGLGIGLAFRLNQGNVAYHTLDRLESFIGGAAGKRLTYKELIQ